MTRSQLTAIVRGLIPTVREYVAGAVDALGARIKAIEEREPVAGPAGKDGAPGVNGKDADPTVLQMMRDEIAALKAQIEALKSAPAIDVSAVIREIVAALPTPKDGTNGKDADPAVLQALGDAIGALKKEIATIPREVYAGSIVAEVLRQIPTPKDGLSVTVDDVRPVIAAEVERAVKAIPPAPAGKDGVSIASAVIDRRGCLVITLSDGITHELGAVVGKDGDPGIAGKDGLGWDDLSAELLDDERTIVLRAKRGDDAKTIGTFTLPIVIDRGVFAEGTTYAKGDGVTWGGSFWIARSETAAKPGLNTDDSRAWRLAIKKGQDGKEGRPGKDGKDGERGPAGPKGERGYGG